MARRRSAVRVSPLSGGVIPTELLSADDAVWGSVESSLDWFALHSLEPDFDVLERGPASRQRAAVEAWARSHEWVRSASHGNARSVVDYVRLREAGVRMRPGRSILERLIAAGVRVEE